MSRKVTAATIIARARRRTDTDTGASLQVYPDADLLDDASEGAAELYDLLIEAQGMDYYATNATAYTSGNDAPLRNNVALPQDFYRLLSVTVLFDSWTTNLRPFTESDRADLLNEEAFGWRRPEFYRMTGISPSTVATGNVGGLQVFPGADTTVPFTVRYVPTCPVFANTSSECWGINGWEEYVVLYLAKKIAMKEDNSGLMAQLGADMMGLKDRISKLAPRRDASASTMITHVRKTDRLGRIRRW